MTEVMVASSSRARRRTSAYSSSGSRIVVRIHISISMTSYLCNPIAIEVRSAIPGGGRHTGSGTIAP